MVTPFAIVLPEIRNHIAEYLSKKELLACCRVAKDWHSSFLPYLWQSVVFNGAGPIFSNADTDPRVVNIRRLRYNYSTFEGPMPMQGYARLQGLEILRESFIKEQKLAQAGPKGGCAVDLWHLPTALVHSLAYGPLSSVELTSIDKASTEFWEALSQCRTLKSFRLDNVCFPIGAAGPVFWKICRSVESLTVILCEAMDCLLIHTRMFRLKHLVVDRSEVQGQLDEWDEFAKPWICSPNLESLEYSYSSTSSGEDEFHEMVLDIKAAIAAAAEGRNHYASEEADEVDDKKEDIEQYRGLIPGKKLHSLETDNYGIRDEDLGYIVHNMDTLRKLCVPWASLGALALEALDRHRHTVVELDLLCDGTNASQILNTVMSCPRLQILTLCNIASTALLESKPWACLRLKRLALNFQKLEWADIEDSRGAKITSESRAIWLRTSQLTELEYLNMDPHGGWGPGFRPDFTLACGLEQLSTLTKLRRVHVDLVSLAVSDAEWMVEAWPGLEVVRGQDPPWDHARIDTEVVKSATFNGAGPVFSGSDLDPRVGYIRRLRYNYSMFAGPMPTHGYTCLTHLEIRRERYRIEKKLCGRGSKGGCAVDLWHLPTALVQGLVGGPLSSLKLALARDVPAAFWVAHLIVEKMNFNVPHQCWESVKPWLCSPYLETLEYNYNIMSTNGDEFHEMVQGIKAATAAVADDENEDMEQYRGLIPGKKLHSLTTNSSIDGEDLGFLVNHMEVHRKLCVPYTSLTRAVRDALLGRHRHTIVELSVSFFLSSSSGVMPAIMGLTQLVVLTLDYVRTEDFEQSDDDDDDPWTCPLRRLSISFRSLVSLGTSKGTTTASRRVWRRIKWLTKLEDLNVYGSGFKGGRFMPVFTLEYGLGQLSTLKELRRVEVDLRGLAATEVDWMIGAWPKLKVVHCKRHLLYSEDD
ncbi:hypothetical protein BG003_006837, partial [Podila horticola]